MSTFESGYPWSYIVGVAAGIVSAIAILFGRNFFLDGIFNNTLSADCRQKNFTGFYAIVTGANRGIGYEITKFLVQHGCNVILACRDESRATTAISSIRQQVQASTLPNIQPGKMQFIPLALDHLQSVLHFVSAYKSKNIPLHFIVHNAAYQTVKYEFTDDKFEKCWQINYLSPFILTHHLLPLIQRSVHTNPDKFYGRIINVTSKGHIHCKQIPYYHFENTESLLKHQHEIDKIAETFNGIEGEYHNTKMGQVLHAIRLQQILNQQVNNNDDSKVKIDAVTAHPGLVNTDIFQWHEKPWYVQAVVKLLSPFLIWMTRTPQQAAECIVHCIVSDRKSPYFAGGGYHSNCRTFTPGYGAQHTAKLIASDLDKLYDVTMKVLNLEPLELCKNNANLNYMMPFMKLVYNDNKCAYLSRNCWRFVTPSTVTGHASIDFGSVKSGL